MIGHEISVGTVHAREVPHFSPVELCVMRELLRKPCLNNSFSQKTIDPLLEASD
jgi:hypothetical protein